VGPLPALAGGGIRFACFNHLAKMNDAVVALRARILGALASPLGDAPRFARHLAAALHGLWQARAARGPVGSGG
jgi:hypothetical protein